MDDFLTLNTIAKDLKLSIRTIQRLAKNNTLPVISKTRRGGYYSVVPVQTYFKWKSEWVNKKNENTFLCRKKSLLSHVSEWISWCNNGLLTGKPQSENTIRTNISYLNYFLEHLPKRYSGSPVISLENLRKVFSGIDPKSYSIKDNIYKAIRSFAKFLIAKELLNKALLDELKEAKPKRVYPPKRLHCTLEQFNILLDEASKKHFGQKPFDIALNKTLIATLGFTGLRASELCNLRLQDIDMMNKRIFVYLGKGKKNRYVGICNSLYQQLIEYLNLRPETPLDNFFIVIRRSSKEPVLLTRKVLLRKIKRLCKYVSFDTNVHGLRRTFATVAANAGKPINIISLALGHSDLKTTQGYLMTSQDEVVKEMQGW